MSEGDTAPEDDDECIDNYPNDPLGQPEHRSPTPKAKKGPGRPKKGKEKTKVQSK